MKRKSWRSENDVADPGISTMFETTSIDLSRPLAGQQFFLKFAHHPGFIGLVDEIVFHFLLLQRHPFDFRILHQLGFAILPQEMQIDGIKNHPAVWRMATNIRDVFPGEIASTQNNDVKCLPVCFEVLADALDVRMAEHFNPTLLQLPGISRNSERLSGMNVTLCPSQ